MPDLHIKKISTELPTKFISNREFCFLTHESDRPTDFNPESADTWIYDRSGIKTRAYFDLQTVGSGNQNLKQEVDYGVSAIQKACSALDWQQTDAIISVRSSPYHSIPSLSQRVLASLNQNYQTPDKTLFTLDLFQPSTGFLAALKVARHLPYSNIIILVSEVLSPLLNLKDPGTSMLFGDAIVAVLVSKEKPEHAEFKVIAESFVSKADSSQVLYSDQTLESFKMKGPELFRKIIPEFKRSSLSLLESAKISREEIQYYLPHQANSRIIERAAHSLHFEPSQVISNIERVGNLSSASMLVALKEAVERKAFPSKTKILLNACGAGLSTGAAILEKT